MKDTFNREINYLRISVTDRCNLRCLYCMPEEGVNLADHPDILTYEEIVRIVKAGVKVGIKKIRLTGGEPLVRKGIVDLVRDISAIPEIDDLALTTNAISLAGLARQLKDAGLKRVNISLDTLIPERFHQVTRGGNFADVWAGIKAALAVGLEPIKINTVIMRGFNDDEILNLAGLTLDTPLNLRFIELMPIGKTEDWNKGKHVSSTEIFDILTNAFGTLIPNNISGSGPAKYYSLPGGQGTIGFIGAISNHFCMECNRLRLTSEGKLRPCLHSPAETDIKTVLRQGATDEELIKVFREVITGKPHRHTMTEDGWGNNSRSMPQIGG